MGYIPVSAPNMFGYALAHCLQIRSSGEGPLASGVSRDVLSMLERARLWFADERSEGCPTDRRPKVIVARAGAPGAGERFADALAGLRRELHPYVQPGASGAGVGMRVQ